MERGANYIITPEGPRLRGNYLAMLEHQDYTIIHRSIDTERLRELLEMEQAPRRELLSIPNIALLRDTIQTDIMGRIPAAIARDGSILDKTGHERPHLPSNWILKRMGRDYTPLQRRWEPRISGVINSLEKLAEMLIEALSNYLSTIGDREVYLSYSGGIDSTLLLLVAEKMGIETRIVTASTPGSGEEERVVETLEMLGIGANIHIALIDEENIDRYLDIASRYIDTSNPILLPIAIAEYAAMSQVPSNRRLIMGQGADELFGGYDKYRREYEHFRTANLIDISTLQYTTTQLEWRIASDLGIYVDYPYTHVEAIETSLQTPSRYKVMDRNDRHRKWVIRKALEILGAPKELYMRPKKAMQYSTGLKKLIKRTAEK